MDTRTITNVFPDSEHEGRTLMVLSDGSTVIFGDWIASHAADGDTIRAEIRTADGSLTGDGPALDDATRAKFTALGVENIPIAQAPLVVAKVGASAPITAPITAPAAAPEVAHPATLNPDGSVTLSAAGREKSKGLLARVASFLEGDEKAFVDELRALWKHL